MSCLFCKIIAKEMAASIIFEDAHLIAINDIQPQAPVHVLIIPKEHIATINHIDENHAQLCGNMIMRAKILANENDISENGYRLVFNVNDGGGQTIHHVHLHLLGGRQMVWPPG